MNNQKQRAFFSVLCFVVILTCFSSAISEVPAESEYYDQLVFMQYHTILDALDESELHISDWISIPQRAYSFEDYVIRIEEIATDGYSCFTSISIEMLRNDAIVLPLSCTDEADFYYIPLSAHIMPVYFFDLSFSIDNNPERSNTNAWALSEDMRTIEFVEIYHPQGKDFRRPISTDMTISFQISVAHYENGTFSTVEHEISLDHTHSCPIEMYEFISSDEIVDATTTLGLAPPSFQVVLTPFQIYTPGLNVRQESNGNVVVAPTYAADGTPFAWILSTENGKLICDGAVCQQFPSNVSLSLYRLTTIYDLVHAWKLQNVDGSLVIQ